MSVGARRSELDIIRDILAAGPGRTCELRDTVNLSHLQLRKYLPVLEGSHLIILYRDASKGVCFSVTSKGAMVLQLVERLTAALTPSALVEAAIPWEEPEQLRRA